MRTILIITLFLFFGIGVQAQIYLDVEGDIIRLTSPSDVNKFIQLRTDGADVDIDVGGFLWINSLGVRIPNPVEAQDAATKAYVDLLEATIKDIIGVKDIDNNRYETVTIGTQVWMAENLRVAHYNDGTPIPLVTDNAAWQDSSNNSNPAYTWYDNGDFGTPDYGAPEYGALYNWYAIDPLSNGDKNVCPVGWHLPTDGDWTMLIDELDSIPVNPDAVAQQSLVSGGKMKETGLGHWNAPNTGATNESGFSGLPGGVRISSGTFRNIGVSGNWWSSTELDASDAWVRDLLLSDGNVYRGGSIKGSGLSVRCLRD